MGKPDPRLLDENRYPFHHAVTTRFTDLDPNGHVNNLATCAALEDARFRMWDALDKNEGSQRLVLSVTTEFLGEAEHGSPIEVHSGVHTIGRTSFTSVQYATQDGQPVAYQTAVMVLRTDGEITMPAYWLPKLESALVPPLPD